LWYCALHSNLTKQAFTGTQLAQFVKKPLRVLTSHWPTLYAMKTY